MPNNISLSFFSCPLPIPFFQMAHRSRRHPTVQMKDKLKALLSLVKVAPVQQRKKKRATERRERQSHKKSSNMYESGIMIHIKIYKSSFNNTQSWQVSSSLIFRLSSLRETLSYSHQASDVTLICNCELIYGVYVCVWHKMPRWENFTPKGVSNTAHTVTFTEN